MRMDYYNETASGYNELHGEEQRTKLGIIKENTQIKNEDLLLDVGCGTGLSSDFDCLVVGIDPSLELLKQNKKAIKIQAAGENIPFKDGSFDVVVSLTSLHNFNDIEKGMDEIKRVGKCLIIYSILKKTKHLEKIKKKMNSELNIIKELDGDKDWIFICEKL